MTITSLKLCQPTLLQTTSHLLALLLLETVLGAEGQADWCVKYPPSHLEPLWRTPLGPLDILSPEALLLLTLKLDPQSGARAISASWGR